MQEDENLFVGRKIGPLNQHHVLEHTHTGDVELQQFSD